MKFKVGKSYKFNGDTFECTEVITKKDYQEITFECYDENMNTITAQLIIDRRVYGLTESVFSNDEVA